MMEIRRAMILRESRRLDGGAGLTIEELARRSGCHPELVERLARFGVIEPSEGAGGPPRFASSALARLRRAVRLRRDFGLNASALGLVLDLLERVEALEAELDRRRRER